MDLRENYHKFTSIIEKKTNDNEKLLRKLRDTIDESTRGLLDLKSIDETGNNLKDLFSILIKTNKIIGEKAEKNTIKLDNLSSEIVMKLKKDLTSILFIIIIFS